MMMMMMARMWKKRCLTIIKLILILMMMMMMIMIVNAVRISEIISKVNKLMIQQPNLKPADQSQLLSKLKSMTLLFFIKESSSGRRDVRYFKNNQIELSQRKKDKVLNYQNVLINKGKEHRSLGKRYKKFINNSLRKQRLFFL